MNVFEVRSEEEGVGNLLLVITAKDYTSDDEALKSLWVEAQEYGEDTPIEKIESDYLQGCKSFELKNVLAKDFESRLNDIFCLFESYNQPLEEIPEHSFLKIKESAMKCAGCSVMLLEDDFTTYSAFIVDGSSKALFSWCDVV